MGHRARRGGRIAGIAVVALLTGCGSAVVGGPAGSTGSSAVEEGRPPTTMPFVRQAPADFRDRAEHIAETLRASGALERYAHDVVLTSDRVAWPDYGGAGELKLLLGNGGYEAGPAVTDEPGTGTIRFTDGRTMQVDVMGARSTLEATKKGRPGCAGVGDEHCPLVMTSAKLGTLRVTTNWGPADVPAWEFSAKELLSPQVVVAVDPKVLPDLPEPVYEEPSWGSLLVADSLVAVDGPAVKVRLLFGACERDLAAHVLEADDIVVIGGSSTPGNGNCPAIGYLASATIDLSKPLADRPLVDVARGAFLTLPETQPQS